MHSIIKVVILLVLLNGIECFSVSDIDNKCDKENGAKVFTAEECGRRKFGKTLTELNEMFRKNETGDNSTYYWSEKECCATYFRTCHKVQAVSNTCVCEPITTDIPLIDRREGTADLTMSGKWISNNIIKVCSKSVHI